MSSAAAESAPRARRGRPRIQDTADDLVASVLATAGSRVGTAEFSTRRVAELTGLSQSVVSRSFRRLRRRGDGAESAAGALELASLQVAFPRLTLTFRPTADPVPAHQHTAAGRRATALLAALRVAGVGQWAADSGELVGRGPRRPEEPHRPEEPGRAGESGSAARRDRAGPASGGDASAVADSRARVPRAVSLQWSPGEDWEAFLDDVAAALDACAPSLDAIPGDLLGLLAARVGRGLHGVDWRRGSPKNHEDSDSESLSVPEYPAPGPGPARDRAAGRWLPHGELSVTEQIAIALRREIMNVGYRPGDRLTAGPLASRLGLGAATVRTAMRRLADDGLLDSGPGGFSVPQVTGADVVDLYAARLHVGMLLLRGCAAQPRHRLLPARLALRAVEAAARQGSGADVEQADLQFQQELAEASGLRQSARSFHALTLRVRMFISVLQLDYAPAAERIVSDDRRMMAAVLDGRSEDAVRIWRSKLDNAARHMSGLAPTAFDPELWARLSR